jgi:hypothetical protein
MELININKGATAQRLKGARGRREWEKGRKATEGQRDKGTKRLRD